MKKLAGILVVLVLSMIAAGAWAENIKGLWSCRDSGHNADLLFIGNNKCLSIDYASGAKAMNQYSWKSVENGIELNHETYLWDGEDLQSKKTGRLYKKQDFSVNKPVWTSAVGIDEFCGDWELAGIRVTGETFNRPAGTVEIELRMHIDEEGGVMTIIAPQRQGDAPKSFMYPLVNPRIEGGKLIVETMGTGNEGVRVEISRYKNGWIEAPLDYYPIEVFYMTRSASPADDSQASSEGVETADHDGHDQDESAGAGRSDTVMHTARGGLEVKASASRSAKKVVTLKKDREVTVLGMEGDWYYIEVDLGNKKVQGYVPADALK